MTDPTAERIVQSLSNLHLMNLLNWRSNGSAQDATQTFIENIKTLLHRGEAGGLFVNPCGSSSIGLP